MKLIRITTFLLLLSAFPFLSKAQISVGIKGGYTTAWEFYNTNLPEGADISVDGFNVSAMIYKPLGKHLQIGIEPGYVQRGAACIPGWQPIFAADTRLLLNYVEAPVMLSGKIPLLNGRMEIFGKVGYGFSRLVRAYQQNTLTDWENPEPKSRIPLNGFNGLNEWDHGVYTGAGIGMKAGPGKLTLEVNHYLGLRDATEGATSKNRSLNFNVGYSISLFSKKVKPLPVLID